MIPELGNFALILAFCLSIVLGTLPIIGAARDNTLWMSLARPLTAGVFVFLSISLVILGYSFVTDDFSVQFVANHSNTNLPLQYKITAVWGGHEGSFLFWTWMLGGWMLAVSIFSKSVPEEFIARVLGVMGLICVGYTLFMLATSNPFDRVLPLPPADGADLNAALQDFAFIVHPPSLYMGYVGFSVVFAFAVAALLSGRLDAAWARWCRPWANAAWAILTLGLSLGSWWAYYELGWGGWWAWDPVENPPLITWLLGAAMIHSLAATEKRGVFKSWTVLLAIMAFASSLLGTFITRSGLLTSVHAFATDPTRGVYILGFLGLIVGGSLLLYAIRAPILKSEFGFGNWSREVFLLANNLILVVASAAILLGTLYPMVYQAVSGGDLISVGPPYFNTIFVPLMGILVVLLGIGPVARWKRTSREYLRQQLTRVAIAAVVLGVAIPVLLTMSVPLGTIGVCVLALWIMFSMLRDVAGKVANKPSLMAGLKSLPVSYWGMQLAHFGFVMTMAGACLTSIYSIERSVLLQAGQQADLGRYTFVFEGTRPVQGPNYIADEGTIRVLRDGEFLRTLHPQKQLYTASNTPATHMGIDGRFLRDLFVTLGDPRDNGAWSMTLYVKPFVRWIWLGTIFIAFGGILAVTDKRYRRYKVSKQASADEQPAEARLAGEH
ncbi:heme lyase CcmF/NrfE family subunit [Pseudohongiella sp. SYSU M77423]|uniref:heme lyase CcmF/NrfE family subunit n=1 Tax=Pseudohongiella sp. SYSU M77423 TaxID=3042312 RepID=UPI0024805C4A|nr:heme lyase CcmF/NrfE family subunit [Pseudohongiella sp. SYSU M77423]MDH7943004.1 heme lyase CcmF/NrfE family subunit [Pseudohongiella sp. SYSU M77423]